MEKQHRAIFSPYLLLSTILTGCAVSFCVQLWQATLKHDGGRLIYAPGFVVQADAVQAIRLVPLAGSILRSPTVDRECGDTVVLLR